MPLLLRTQAALENFSEFVARNDRDPFREAFIESLCVNSIAVMCIAEVEEIIASKIRDRLSTAVDNRAAAFIATKLADIIKRTQKSDVAKTVKLFGEECAEKFNQAFEPYELTAYDNIRTHRQDTAHGEGGQMTYSDLALGIAAAEKVVSSFSECVA
jgi:hypothetical protein